MPSFSFVGFVYRVFGKLARSVYAVYPTLPTDVRRAGIKVHHEVYASIVVFATFLSLIVSVAAMVFLMLFRPLPLPMTAMIVVLLIPLPALVFTLTGFVIPRIRASSASTRYDRELPFAVSYLATMITGVPSLVYILHRLAAAKDLFKYLSRVAFKILVYVKCFGLSPIEATDRVANELPSAKAREFFLGLTATLKAGGDVADYIYKKSAALFDELLTVIRTSANRLSTVLESYLAIINLTLITFTAIFLINASIAEVSVPGFGPETAFLVLGIVMPFLSFATIVLIHSIQYSEPVFEKRPKYVLFGATLPLAIFLVMLSLGYRNMPPRHPLRGYGAFIEGVMKFLGIDPALYNGIAIALSLAIAVLPTAIVEFLTTHYYTGLLSGLTQFLRDLAEIRKTGLPPEKCIIALADREYGPFSRILKRASTYLNMGLTVKQAFARIVDKIPLWRVRVLLYSLVDSIEAGGGTPEIFDRLAAFSESTLNIAQEYRSMIRTLIVVPYIGAIVMLLTVGMIMSFAKSMAIRVIAYQFAVSMILPLLMINIFILGFVIGKLATGRITSGSIHSLLLLLVSLISMLAIDPLSRLLIGGMK